MKPTITTVSVDFGRSRSIKELLQIMLDNQDLFLSGLCHWNHSLKNKELITSPEYYKLADYISINRPWYKWIKRLYWWKEGDINPRIKWIKKHIQKN